MAEMHEFESRMHQIDDLLRQAEETNPAAQAQLQDLASGLLDVHGLALRRIMEHLADAGETGAAIIDAIGRDEVVSPLLVLHGLHPLGLEDRLKAALEKVGPYLASHGGHVELLSVSADGAVALRLEGSCHGCPSSRVTLQTTIEQEIAAAAPEVTSISVEGLVEEPAAPQAGGFVPVELLSINGAAPAAVS